MSIGQHHIEQNAQTVNVAGRGHFKVEQTLRRKEGVFVRRRRQSGFLRRAEVQKFQHPVVVEQQMGGRYSAVRHIVGGGGGQQRGGFGQRAQKEQSVGARIGVVGGAKRTAAQEFADFEVAVFEPAGTVYLDHVGVVELGLDLTVVI